eukprot:Rmarinus@m.11827
MAFIAGGSIPTGTNQRRLNATFRNAPNSRRVCVNSAGITALRHPETSDQHTLRPGNLAAQSQPPAAEVSSPNSKSVTKTTGAKKVPLVLTLSIGLLIYCIGPPPGVTAPAWNLLAIFLATVFGIITQPLPLGAVALLGLGASCLFGVLTFNQAFSAFATEIPWLIAIAFFFSRGFVKTGLGTRLAYLIVSHFGHTTLGLCYSLVFGELLLAPAIPSSSARAGGIFVPLIRSLCEQSGSYAHDKTATRRGSFLMSAVFQAGLVSSAMFMTAMASNPLSVSLVKDVTGHAISWMDWTIAAVVPGIVSLLLVPLLLYVLEPPEVKVDAEGPRVARERLQQLGPFSPQEMIMAFALLLTIGLWIFGGAFGIGAVTAALVGLAILLTTGVISWKECLGETVAWDTLTWFAALIAMADYLNKFGLTKWMSSLVVQWIAGLGLSWPGAFALICLLYFYAHYFFASSAAHVGALFTACLSVAVGVGTPPKLAALALCFLSNLMGGLTHYGFGSAPIFFGTGYLSLPRWWMLGLATSIMNLIIWLTVGGAWWKLLGLW